MVRSQLFYGIAGNTGNEQGSVETNHLCLGQLQTSNNIHYPLAYQIFYTSHKESLERSLLPLPEIFLNIPLQLCQNRIYLSLNRIVLLETKKSLAGGSNPFARTEPSCIFKKLFLLEFEKLIVLSVARYRKGKRNFPLDYFENFIEN